MGASNTKTSPAEISNESSNLREDSEYGSPLKYDANFQGPVKRRKCTDVICIFIFLAFLGGWAFVAYVGMTRGDINKVLYPTDSEGRICGYGNMQNRSYLLYFDLTRCLNPAVLSLGCTTNQVCVEKCPSEIYSGYAAIHAGYSDLTIKNTMRPFCSPFIPNWESKTPKELIDQDLCPAWVLPSSALLGRCFPTLIDVDMNENGNKTIIDAGATLNSKAVDGQTIFKAVTSLGAFLNLRNFGERVFNDISDTWWIIVIGLLGACILSFLWIILMRYLAGIMIWTSIGLVFSSVGSLLAYSTYRYINVKDITESQGSILSVNFTPDYFNDVISLSSTWLIFIISLAVVFIILLLILIALRQRIVIAIKLIEQGSKATGNMRSTLLFPILPFAINIVVLLWFTLIALYLSSAMVPEFRITVQMDEMRQDIACECGSIQYEFKDVCDPTFFNQTCASSCPGIYCQFVKYVKSDDSSWMIWYNLFGLYWGLNFISALSELILACVFATWYWTQDKSTVPFFTLGWSVYISLFFHLGTVAFGSFIISIIQFLRTILSYLESKLKAYNNELTKCLLCMCKCCLWCLEKFLRFLNRNAYIMCAIDSTNFCVSAKHAFNLLMRNLVRVVVLDKVVDFLLFLGKLVIVVGIGTFSYFFFRGDIVELQNNIPTLNCIFTPIVIIVIGSYFIASSFFGVYSMAVDTLFLCFLEDLERNDGSSTKPYYMTRELQRVIGKMNKFHANQVKLK